MDRKSKSFVSPSSGHNSPTFLELEGLPNKSATASSGFRPNHKLSKTVSAKLEPLHSPTSPTGELRGTGPKLLRSATSDRDLVPMMDEFSMADTRVLRTTQSDRDMRSLVITTKLKHLEAQEQRKKQDAPALLTSPIERKKRAFKPGAPPITGAIPALDVPFVHLGGEPSFYGGSPARTAGERFEDGYIAEATMRAMLEEWLTSYDIETRCYNSGALEAEVKLRRAEVFTAKLESPNALSTAVAFEVLDGISSLCGRYSGILGKLRSLLLKAVYVEPAAHEPEVSEWDRSAVETYYRLTPYFAHMQESEAEKKRLKEAIWKLKDAILAQERRHEKGLDVTKKSAKAVDIWKRVSTKAVHAREINALTATLLEKEDEIDQLSHHNFESIEGIMELFMELDEVHRHLAVTRMMQLMPERWGVLSRWLLATMPKEQLVHVVRDAFTEDDNVTLMDIVRAFSAMFRSKKVTSLMLGQANILRELIMQCGNVGPVLPALVAKLSPMQRVAMSRCLAGVDTSPVPDAPLKDYMDHHAHLIPSSDGSIAKESTAHHFDALVAEGGSGTQRDALAVAGLQSPVAQAAGGGDAIPEQVKDPHPGMYAEFLECLTVAEKLQLLQDLLADTATLAFPVVVDALTTNSHPLTTELDRAEDRPRENLLKHVVRCAPQWMICKYAPSVDDGKPRISSSSDGRVEPAIASPKHARVSDEDAAAKDKEVAVKVTAPVVPTAYLPLAKFLKKPPGGVKYRSRDLNATLSVVYESFERKLKEDAADLADGALPEDLTPYAEMLQLFLVQKYGLPSLSEAHMYGLVESTIRMSEHSIRLRLFGVMTGLIDRESYTPRIAAVVFHLVKLAFPKFTVNTFRMYKEGRLPLLLTQALSVAAHVFTDSPLPISYDRLMLTDGRRDALMQDLRNAAETFKAAQTRMQALAAAASASTLEDSEAQSFEEIVASKHSATQSAYTYRPEDVVIDWDRFLEICIQYWKTQTTFDLSKLRELFFTFCGTSYQRLTHPQFCKLIATIAPSKRYTSRQLTKMFDEINSLDDNDKNDAISPEMFMSFCRQNGFVAPREDNSGTAIVSA